MGDHIRERLGKVKGSTFIFMFSAYIDQIHFKTILNLDFISVVSPYTKFTHLAVTSCRVLYEYILCTENNEYCLKKKYIRLRAWNTVISICSLTNTHFISLLQIPKSSRVQAHRALALRAAILFDVDGRNRPTVF